MTGSLTSVSLSGGHTFSKRQVSEIRLLEGVGVEGDAHCGATVKHRSRVAVDPTQPNLRQVHLIHEELFAELREKGFSVLPGEIGENITTRGIDLLELPTDTDLLIGDSAIVRIKGLRNPCAQLDALQQGLMAAVLERAEDGSLIRKSGVMGIVIAGGIIRPGDGIRLVSPSEPYRPLECV